MTVICTLVLLSMCKLLMQIPTNGTTGNIPVQQPLPSSATSLARILQTKRICSRPTYRLAGQPFGRGVGLCAHSRPSHSGLAVREAKAYWTLVQFGPIVG